MGCGNPKEKIEDELMKAKLERAKVLFEKQTQIQLLKDLDGTEYKSSLIRDNTISTKFKRSFSKKRKTFNKVILRPRRSKSFVHKKDCINFEEIHLRPHRKKTTRKLKN